MKFQKYSNLILRIVLALVFLYFGFSQIIRPDNWAEYIPKFLTGTILTANNWIIFNGILEITLGIFLVFGLYLRFASLILSIHLLLIAISIGFNPLGIRDFGLALATFVIFLNGPDKYCLDIKFKKKFEKI